MKKIRPRILYCGDDRLDLAAKYLGAILASLGYSFFHVPSSGSKRRLPLDRPWDLVILSDFPSARMTLSEARQIAARVHEGAALWMIGGWGSFAGFDGGYGRSPLAEALPVVVSKRDDRVQGGTVYRVKATPRGVRSFAGMDFGTAPGIAGFNRVKVRPGAVELLDVLELSPASERNGNTRFKTVSRDPLLVRGGFGRGRTLALMTDLAPHWCGGIVDWGRPKRFDAPSGGWIQTGLLYREWVRRMLALLLE